MLVLFPEKYYFVLYTICMVRLLKGYGSRVFAANLATWCACSCSGADRASYSV